MSKILDREVALEEFERFLDAMDIYVEPGELDAEDLAAFNKQKSRIVRALENGSLVINDKGEAEYTPQRTSGAETIVFHERTGASLMAMDGKKKGHDVAKTYAVMADMCRVHPSTFAKLVGVDGKVCEALFALLMD